MPGIEGRLLFLLLLEQISTFHWWKIPGPRIFAVLCVILGFRRISYLSLTCHKVRKLLSALAAHGFCSLWEECVGSRKFLSLSLGSSKSSLHSWAVQRKFPWVCSVTSLSHEPSVGACEKQLASECKLLLCLAPFWHSKVLCWHTLCNQDFFFFNSNFFCTSWSSSFPPVLFESELLSLGFYL